MPDPFVRHGDAEALIIHILRDLTPELDEFDLDGISTTLRGYSEGKRWIMVSQEGSSKALWNVINKPRIDLDVRGEGDTSVVRDIAEIAEASIFRAKGAEAYGAKLCSVKEEMGITRIPDVREEASARYVFSLRLTCTVVPESESTP